MELDFEVCEMEAVFVFRLKTSEFCCPKFESGVELGGVSVVSWAAAR